MYVLGGCKLQSKQIADNFNTTHNATRHRSCLVRELVSLVSERQGATLLLASVSATAGVLLTRNSKPYDYSRVKAVLYNEQHSLV